MKWAEDRLENFLSAYQGRGLEADVELAVSSDGRLLGVRARLYADLGAYLVTTTPVSAHTAALLLTGAYDIAAAGVTIVGARTNKVPTGPYRGAGRPEAAYLIERMVDEAAASSASTRWRYGAGTSCASSRTTRRSAGRTTRVTTSGASTEHSSSARSNASARSGGRAARSGSASR